jgi:hypothetical protein
MEDIRVPGKKKTLTLTQFLYKISHINLNGVHLITSGNQIYNFYQSLIYVHYSPFFTMQDVLIKFYEIIFLFVISDIRILVDVFLHLSEKCGR